MKPTITIRKALSDPKLLGKVLKGESWGNWRTLLIAAMGEALTEAERETFTKLTGREREPGKRVEEMAAVIGRRGGKSRAMATLAVYIAGLCDHRDVLVPGERGVLLCIAPDQKQAAITLDYATAAFEASPILRQLIAARTTDSLELTNGISIEVRAASFRRLRGPTYIGVIADEAAFWYDETSANADVEILNAVRPGLATTGGPLMIASSPYARRGALWDVYRRHFGAGGDPLILVAQGASRDFNEKSCRSASLIAPWSVIPPAPAPNFWLSFAPTLSHLSASRLLVPVSCRAFASVRQYQASPTLDFAIRRVAAVAVVRTA